MIITVLVVKFEAIKAQNGSEKQKKFLKMCLGIKFFINFRGLGSFISHRKVKTLVSLYDVRLSLRHYCKSLLLIPHESIFSYITSNKKICGAARMRMRSR
jgi:hypothetical protein